LIGIGIIGCNFGRLVHLPAFRHDRRCKVVALAGRDAVRTAELAKASHVPLAFGSWENLVEHPSVDAIAIATAPHLQPTIAIRALELGKSVFAEKPMAGDLTGAQHMMEAAQASRRAATIDFSFCEILSWKRARTLINEGAIGRVRHVDVNWNVENYGTRMRLKNWKTLGNEGGGVLGNFVSHCFHYLEWFCGPIVGMSARLSGLFDAPELETNAGVNVMFQSGAAGRLAVSCASYLGSGHRIEIYGEDGALTLVNATTDYMRGFQLSLGRRPATLISPIDIVDETDLLFPSDGRIAPISRVASGFLDSIEQRAPDSVGFAQGLRVQGLLDTARRANDLGRWLELEPELRGQRL
jgi:predicted dehydrogenase